MGILAKNALHAIRQRQGISAAKIAALVGVARQTIYAIEAGKYVPNTVVALQLAAVLDSTVEKLFRLDAGGSSAGKAQKSAGERRSGERGVMDQSSAVGKRRH